MQPLQHILTQPRHQQPLPAVPPIISSAPREPFVPERTENHGEIRHRYPTYTLKPKPKSLVPSPAELLHQYRINTEELFVSFLPRFSDQVFLHLVGTTPLVAHQISPQRIQDLLDGVSYQRNGISPLFTAKQHGDLVRLQVGNKEDTRIAPVNIRPFGHEREYRYTVDVDRCVWQGILRDLQSMLDHRQLSSTWVRPYRKSPVDQVHQTTALSAMFGSARP